MEMLHNAQAPYTLCDQKRPCGSGLQVVQAPALCEERLPRVPPAAAWYLLPGTCFLVPVDAAPLLALTWAPVPHPGLRAPPGPPASCNCVPRC